MLPEEARRSIGIGGHRHDFIDIEINNNLRRKLGYRARRGRGIDERLAARDRGFARSFLRDDDRLVSRIDNRSGNDRGRGGGGRRA